MKKNFSKFALIALVSLFVLSSCEKDSDSDPKPTPPPTPPSSLETPKNIAFDTKTLTFTWDKVKDAAGYQCVVDNFLSISFADIIKGNSAIITNPVRDVWKTFYVRATNGDVHSDIANFEFIVTDKTILDTPTKFVYDIIERTDKGLKLKFTWNPVNNANAYNCSYTVQSGDFSKTHSTSVKTAECVTSYLKVGSKVTISVRALPAEGSSEYAQSKQGVAQIKELK
ncbi:MAG: hypothetical protein RR513_10145 [Muribaculaceae bacterium]